MLALCMRKTLSISSKAFHFINILKRKSGTKGNQCLCCKTCRNARDSGESSLKKELPPGWFYIHLLSCGHLKKQLWIIIYFMKSWTRREKSVLCWALQKQTLRWFTPGQFGKGMGSSREGEISGKGLWQQAWSSEKTMEFRLCFKVWPEGKDLGSHISILFSHWLRLLPGDMNSQALTALYICR